MEAEAYAAFTPVLAKVKKLRAHARGRACAGGV